MSLTPQQVLHTRPGPSGTSWAVDPSVGCAALYDAVAGSGPLPFRLDDPEVEGLQINEPLTDACRSAVRPGQPATSAPDGRGHRMRCSESVAPARGAPWDTAGVQCRVLETRHRRPDAIRVLALASPSVGPELG